MFVTFDTSHVISGGFIFTHFRALQSNLIISSISSVHDQSFCEQLNFIFLKKNKYRSYLQSNNSSRSFEVIYEHPCFLFFWRYKCNCKIEVLTLPFICASVKGPCTHHDFLQFLSCTSSKHFQISELPHLESHVQHQWTRSKIVGSV